MKYPVWIKPVAASLILLVGLIPVVLYLWIFGRVPQLDAGTALKMLNDPGRNAVLVDVRTGAEFSPLQFYRAPLTDLAQQAIGAESMKCFARVKQTIASGAPVAIGSDWPTGAIDANPLRMLQVLVTRKNPYERNGDAPLGDTISVEDAIRVMTLGGAYSMRKENELGSIEKGKAADMVVLNRNLFEIAPDSIIDSKVVYTIFAGKIVYDEKMPE